MIASSKVHECIMNQGGTADITVLESLTFKTVFLIIRGNYMYYPSLEMLEKLDLKSYDLVPIKKEIYSDMITPIELMRKLKQYSKHVYMLESHEDKTKWGRYTFIGFDPKSEITCYNKMMKVDDKIFNAAGMLLPLPHLLDEALAAQTVAGQAFLAEVARHHHLGGDAGVVGAHLPQRVAAEHAVIADQRVLQRVLERVAHVQGAGDVRRRQQDGVGRALAARLEYAAAFPLFVQAGFELFGIVAGVEGHRSGIGIEE